jgi:hypothetical protein
MSQHKGGRGLKAPYETTHIRVPVPLKDALQRVIDAYKECLDVDQALASLGNVQDDKPTELNLLTPNEAIQLAQNILTQKKSAKISMGKLLTGIYSEDIVL